MFILYMSTREKRCKKLIKKTRKTHKKTKRNVKNNKSNKNNKKYIGGNDSPWLDSSKIDDKEQVCPICLIKFSETPNQALYKTKCNHIFHNNCLAGVCEHKYSDYIETYNNISLPVCPICRTQLDAERGSFQCMDVIVFQNNLFDDDTINKYFSPKIKKIYYAQLGEDYEENV